MNLYAYAGNNPLNYTDPFGLSPCLAGPVALRICAAAAFAIGGGIAAAASQIYHNVSTGSGATAGVGLAALAGVRDGAAMALGAELTSALATRLAGSGASAGTLQTTQHGAGRLADPTRLGTSGAQAVMANPTQTLTQADGASVFVQAVDGRFNVVVQGEQGIITTFKNLSQKSLDRLARNYGWTE